jgi:hypothetical protein
LCVIIAEFYHCHIDNAVVWRATKYIHADAPVLNVRCKSQYLIVVFCVLNARKLRLLILFADVSGVITGTITNLRASRVVRGEGHQFLNCELHALEPFQTFTTSER